MVGQGFPKAHEHFSVVKSYMKQKDVLSLTFWRISQYVSPEKVHFQHTAKFIAQLINEKANYTLQVCVFFFYFHSFVITAVDPIPLLCLPLTGSAILQPLGAL